MKQPISKCEISMNGTVKPGRQSVRRDVTEIPIVSSLTGFWINDGDWSRHRKQAASKELQDLGNLHPSEVKIHIILVPSEKWPTVLHYVEMSCWLWSLLKGSVKGINCLKTSMQNGTHIEKVIFYLQPIKTKEFMEFLKKIEERSGFLDKKQLNWDKYVRVHSTLYKSEMEYIKYCHISS